ncbi:hypothetical protein BG015_000032 [Linnemannia schmuckeri]|uniref:Uncharacterized protein n=1 Tax=Linnemannia schmuckeri TaxID=64567 RepID=A0A9P5S7B3_9FUNG|nr:hypothetical protein BG015_000032 [Linnemannia schmuckeri]
MGKIKLHKDQKAYLETTAGSDITLTGFTKATKLPLGAVELENIWSHAAIPYLANHTSLNEQQAAKRLVQHKIKQRLAEFKTAVMMRNHTSNLMVHVTQELEIVAAHHVKEYRAFMHDGDGQKHPQESTDDESEEETDRPSPKRSKQEPATSKLLGPLLSSEDETSDFRTSSLRSSTQSSLNSIEFTHFNRLVGRGTTSCQLLTDTRIMVDGTDVSQTLMEVRRNVLRRQSEVREVDELLSRDPFPTPHLFDEEYYPDYFAELEGFPIMVAEVKKPGVVSQEAMKDDQRKLPSLLKLAIDRMLEAGVVEPTAVGILVQGSRCAVSLLTLEKEAIYLHRSVGVFQIPTSNIQLGLLLAALGPLATAKATVKKTFDAIEGRSGQDSTKAWRRPSYHLKGVKIPGPVIPEDDKEE